MCPIRNKVLTHVNARSRVEIIDQLRQYDDEFDSEDDNSDLESEDSYDYLAPLGEDQSDEGQVALNAAADSASCAICNSAPGAKPMTRTRCCGNAICDTEQDYVMFSYSRNQCPRSHQRYTLCGYHGEEAHCDKSKDWRECPGCDPLGPHVNSVADSLWRGLNPYNFCPLLARKVPKHSMCETCIKCGKKLMSGVEGSSYSSVGGVYGVSHLSCAR